MTFYFSPDIEPFKVPPEYVKIIKERTTGFVAAAFEESPTDINKAIRSAVYSAYIQGLHDAAVALRGHTGAVDRAGPLG